MLGRNIAIKGDFDQSLEECEEQSRESFYHLWEYLRNQQNSGEHVNAKEGPGEVSEGNEKHVRVETERIFAIKWQKMGQLGALILGEK